MTTIVTRSRSLYPQREALITLETAGFRRVMFNEPALTTAPLFESLEVDYGFDQLEKPDRLVPCTEVDSVFRARYGCNHTPDFVGVCAMLVANPTLVDIGPIVIQWITESGRYCYAVWSSYKGDRTVHVARNSSNWSGSDRFPRIREQNPKT